MPTVRAEIGREEVWLVRNRTKAIWLEQSEGSRPLIRGKGTGWFAELPQKEGLELEAVQLALNVILADVPLLNCTGVLAGQVSELLTLWQADEVLEQLLPSLGDLLPHFAMNLDQKFQRTAWQQLLQTLQAPSYRDQECRFSSTTIPSFHGQQSTAGTQRPEFTQSRSRSHRLPPQQLGAAGVSSSALHCQGTGRSSHINACTVQTDFLSLIPDIDLDMASTPTFVTNTSTLISNSTPMLLTTNTTTTNNTHINSRPTTYTVTPHASTVSLPVNHTDIQTYNNFGLTTYTVTPYTSTVPLHVTQTDIQTYNNSKLTTHTANTHTSTVPLHLDHTDISTQINTLL